MPAYILRGTEVQFPYEAYQCQVHTSPRNFSPILLNIQHDLGLFAFLFLVAHVRYLIDLQLDYMERVLQALQEVLSGLHHALIKVDSHRTALTLYTIHRKGPSCSMPGLAATVSRSAAGKECPVGEPYRHRKDVVPALCRPCLAGVPESQAGEPNAIIHLVSSNQFLSNRTCCGYHQTIIIWVGRTGPARCRPINMTHNLGSCYPINITCTPESCHYTTVTYGKQESC